MIRSIDRISQMLGFAFQPNIFFVNAFWFFVSTWKFKSAFWIFLFISCARNLRTIRIRRPGSSGLQTLVRRFLPGTSETISKNISNKRLSGKFIGCIFPQVVKSQLLTNCNAFVTPESIITNSTSSSVCSNVENAGRWMRFSINTKKNAIMSVTN